MKRLFVILTLLFSIELSAQEQDLSNVFEKAQKTLMQLWNCKRGINCPDKADMYFLTKPDYVHTSEYLTDILFTASNELQGNASNVRWHTTVDKKKVSVVYYFDNGSPEKRDILGLIEARYSLMYNVTLQDTLLLLSNAKFTEADKVKNKEVLLNEINATMAAWKEN